MKTTKYQVEEITILNDLANRIRTDQKFMEMLFGETENYQPVMFSGMMYFSEELEPSSALDVVTLFLIVWCGYRSCPGCLNEVTQEQYNVMQKKTFDMFNYLDGEDDMSVFDVIAGHEFERRQLPLLPVFINHAFEHWPALKNLNQENSAVIHLFLKVFIDCFENKIEEES